MRPSPENLTPYLSVVVTTRNDDHGGDPLKRLQSLVNTIEAQCRRTGLDAELIVVEWNPPVDKPRVADLLRLPDAPVCTYRFLDVPTPLHQRLQYADVLPLFQMIAKNVGIRRARGRFVLATNIDVIFSSELVDLLAARRLEPDRMYRVDRHDIRADFPVDAPLAQQMEFCRSHQLRVHRRWGTYATDAAGTPVVAAADVADGRAVTLGAGWHIRENNVGGTSVRWASAEAEILVDAESGGLTGDTRLDIDVESNPDVERSSIALEIVEGDAILRQVTVSGRSTVEVPLGRATGKPRRIRLRVGAGAADQRGRVPLFDLRSAMYYRVYGVHLRPASGGPALFDYGPDGWTHADQSVHIAVERTREGVAVATDPAPLSYCVQYGPLRSPRADRYRFLLRYSATEGAVTFGALSGDRERWLTLDSKHALVDGAQQIELSLDVLGEETFWLVVSNSHPDGFGVSRFLIHDLRGSADPAALVCTQPPARSGVTALVRAKDVRRTLSRAAIRRRLSSWGDAIVSRVSPRLSPRVRFRIVRSAPEYLALEEALKSSASKVRELEPLGSFAQLDRFLREKRPDSIHINASGDFQLMARENWHVLRGYPEFETFSMSIDGLFSYIADAAGVKEQVLDAPIYHLEHEVGSGWSPEGEAALRRRIAERGITWIEVPTVYMWAAYMRWLRRPFIFNPASWGFGDDQLPERVVAAAAENVSR